MAHAIARGAALCLSGCLLAGGAWAQADGLDARLADAQARGGYDAALLYSELGQYGLALQHADAALVDATPAMQCRATALQLDARLRLEALPDGDATFARAIEDCLAVDDVAAASAIRITFARALHGDGRTRDAFELLRLHVNAIDASGAPRLAADAHARLAEFALALGRGDEAAAHARSAVALATDDPLTEARAIAHRVLHELALAAGDDARALVHYRLHAKAAKAHGDAARNRDLAYAVARHESGLRAREIALLEERNKALALEAELRRSVAQRTLLGAGLLAILVGLFAFWAVRVDRRHRAFQAVADSDPATGAANRRSFLRSARSLLARAGRDGTPVALVLVGLDGLRGLREDHGGLEAERILAATVDACRRAFRPGDVVGRIGGDMLAVALPGCGRFEAARLAEGCVDALDPRLQVAIGVADSANAGAGVEALLEAADRALHRAMGQSPRRVGVDGADPLWARRSGTRCIPEDAVAARA